MRVLLAFEEEYRVYMEALAGAIRAFRSEVEVVVVDSEELEAEVERLDPQLVTLRGYTPSRSAHKYNRGIRNEPGCC